MDKSLVSFFILGLTFGWGPCLASCGPILLSYITGARKDIPKSLSVYILFSAARILVYLALSLTVFFSGNFFMDKYLYGYSKYIYLGGGLIIILAGILLACGKRLEIKHCRILQKNFLEADVKSVVALGLIIGLLPCGPLLAVFSWVALVSRSWFDSLLISLSFGIGTFFSPLLMLVIFAGAIPSFLKAKRFERIFNLVCGLIIVFLGLQLIRKGF